jgi:hypothetical protein
MIRVFLSACILCLQAPVAVSSVGAAEAMTTISILSPRNGETVENTFNLIYEILNAPKDNHAHVYLDGTYQKGFQGTFTQVPKGEHTITVKIADHDHKDTNTPTDTITVNVTE